MRLVKELATAKFDETVEVHLRTGVDPRYAEQQVRGVVTLPAGTGREVRIVVFAGPDGQELARKAGADFVGGEDLAEKIQGGWLDFDVVLATPDMMRVVGRLGRVLGPRGMMPTPKTGTVLPAEDLPACHRRDPSGAASSSVWTRPPTFTCRSARPRSTTTS